MSNLLNRRVRGVRVVNLWAMGLLLVLVIALYLVKIFAGAERTDIAETQDQIADEQRRIGLLKAEIAFLERPDRIERLAERDLDEQPLSGKHEATLDQLPVIARQGQSAKLAEPAQ
jgi:hypothetical protein